MARGAGATVLLAAALGGAAGCEAQGVAVREQGIIGGLPSDPDEFLATGALLKGWAYRCTATLIAPDVVLTAAHCLEDTGYGHFAFTLDPDLSDGKDDEVPVLLTHQHPDYMPKDKPLDTGRVNDVGIAILARPIEGVPVEVLHASDDDPAMAAGDELQVCGYGVDTWHARSTVGIKRDAHVFLDHVAPWELRTVRDDPQPCIGDSGGPLWRETPTGRQLTGIVVRGVGDAYRCDNGAIASRIAPYVSWIEEASLDRDTGCSVGGRGRPSPVALLALVGLVLFRRRRTYSRM